MPMSRESSSLTGNNIVGQLIFLNGVNGSGKSSISKALQKSLTKPFLYLEFDHFISMLSGKKDLEAFQRMVKGFHHSIATLLACENDIILDHVLFNPAWLDQIIDLLDGHDVLFVKLFCPIHILEQREKSRYGSIKGIAKQQFKAVYKERAYDLEVNTSEDSVESIVESILNKLRDKDFLAFSILKNEQK
jgi:chloramphenicol 3-O phosphotransferase